MNKNYILGMSAFDLPRRRTYLTGVHLIFFKKKHRQKNARSNTIRICAALSSLIAAARLYSTYSLDSSLSFCRVQSFKSIWF
jgi:hypothetical protein